MVQPQSGCKMKTERAMRDRAAFADNAITQASVHTVPFRLPGSRAAGER